MSLGLLLLLTALVIFNIFLFCGGGSFPVSTEDEQDRDSYGA